MTFDEHFPIPLTGEIRQGGSRFYMTLPLVYRDTEIDLIVPAGFITDFHSVPRGLWNLFPPWRFPEAAVIHDYLYRHPGDRPRAQCDGIYRRVLDISGSPLWQRQGMWMGVRFGGWKPW